ncbi:MAG TPA: aspartate aminotransferase family protein, partial [Pseudonocardiaceae bacterium]
TLDLAAGVAGVPGLRVVGTPAATLLAFAATTDGPDVLVVADELRARGWVLQPQPAYGELPPTVHLTVTAATAPLVTALLADLEASVKAAADQPPATPDPALVAAAREVDVAALTPEVVTGLLELAGLGADGSLPARMAPVHALLGVLPPPLAERLLAEVISRTYT